MFITSFNIRTFNIIFIKIVHELFFVSNQTSSCYIFCFYTYYYTFLSFSLSTLIILHIYLKHIGIWNQEIEMLYTAFICVKTSEMRLLFTKNKTKKNVICQYIIMKYRSGEEICRNKHIFLYIAQKWQGYMRTR